MAKGEQIFLHVRNEKILQLKIHFFVQCASSHCFTTSEMLCNLRVRNILECKGERWSAIGNDEIMLNNKIGMKNFGLYGGGGFQGD